MGDDEKKPMGSPSATVGVEKDQSSPLYLHPSEAASQLQVGDVLTSSNYGEWVVEMTDALIIKNKFGFVDGTIEKPTTNPDLIAWTRCDAIVKGWLHTAMDKEVRATVRYARTAQEIWTDLRDRFCQGSASRAYEIRRLVSLLQQEKFSVSSFYTRLLTYWEESQSISPSPKCSCGLCTCGLERRTKERDESNRLFDFLMGLDDSFGTVCTQVLTMKPTPSLTEAFNIVLSDEQ
ncbi:unnamed protein product [Linum trigynum]|uniref:Retrotransposon Copia-like N-terminal domain-containing protein n=1 Tax=Linum trigynum TaxID=586398 RepID=A0AAV2GN08_9ROSI